MFANHRIDIVYINNIAQLHFKILAQIYLIIFQFLNKFTTFFLYKVHLYVLLITFNLFVLVYNYSCYIIVKRVDFCLLISIYQHVDRRVKIHLLFLIHVIMNQLMYY